MRWPAGGRHLGLGLRLGHFEPGLLGGAFALFGRQRRSGRSLPLCIILLRFDRFALPAASHTRSIAGPQTDDSPLFLGLLRAMRATRVDPLEDLCVD